MSLSSRIRPTPISARNALTTVGGALARAVHHLRRGWAAQLELRERWLLRYRPWEEEFLHWRYDGESWFLHGRLLPPRGRRLGATRSGWCPHAPTTGTAATGNDGHPGTPG
jgi:hypothetical protein